MHPEQIDDVWERTTQFPQLRRVIAAEHAYLPDEDLAELVDELFGQEATAEELENFLRTVGRVARNALPGVIQGATTGAAAGPWGALIGGLAGGAISAATAGRGQRAPRPRAAQPRPRVPAPAPAPARAPSAPGTPSLAAGGAPAIQTLLSLLNNPAVVQALSSMLMGRSGARSFEVAGQPVPVAAAANLLSVVAARAAAEYHAQIAGESAGIPEYLMDAHGELVCDPSDSVQRAEVVLSLLQEQARFDATLDAIDDEIEDAAWGEDDDMDDDMDLLDEEELLDGLDEVEYLTTLWEV